jgi:hypothetical protein
LLIRGAEALKTSAPLFSARREHLVKIGHVLLLVGLMLVVVYASNNFAPLKNIVG